MNSQNTDTNARNIEIRPLSDDELDTVASGSVASTINAVINYLSLANVMNFYAAGGGVGALLGQGLK